MSTHKDVSYVEVESGVKEMTTEWLLSEKSRLEENDKNGGTFAAIKDEIEHRKNAEGRIDLETRELGTLTLNEGHH